MGLLYIPGLASFNNNRWWIGRNKCFTNPAGAGIAGLEAMIRVKRLFDSTIINNNLEGGNKGVLVFGGGANNTWINNSGECNTHDEPFYEFNATTNQTVIGGRCETKTNSTGGMFVRTVGDCDKIVVFNPHIAPSTASATRFKDRLVGNDILVPAMEAPA